MCQCLRVCVYAVHEQTFGKCCDVECGNDKFDSDVNVNVNDDER